MTMKHIRLLALLFASLSCAAQTKTPYDNFDHKFLSPSLWNPFPACITSNGRELECVRRIEDEKLHLANRSFGDRSSNTGLQDGFASIDFVNPNSIKSITTDIVVRSVEEVPCAANPGFGGSAIVYATFFNTGTAGDHNDDVSAQVVVGRAASDPPGQVTVSTSIQHHGDDIDGQSLGSVPLGTPVTVSLTWDQANQQILVSWTNKTTQAAVSTTLPYTFSVTAPAAVPLRRMQANGFPANCTANQTSVFVDAFFYNVYFGH
jgi:hypothetical protein